MPNKKQTMEIASTIAAIDEAFKKRLAENTKPLFDEYCSLYEDATEKFNELLQIAEEGFYERRIELKKNDLIRGKKPEWFLSQNNIAISLYVDLFSDSLPKLHDKIGYLKDLGINLIHFMPLLKTRDGNNDGGFAISSYTQINPKLGTMADFEKLNDVLRRENITVCIDFVANHTAQEHEWALKAQAGDEEYQKRYLMYDNYDIPEKFEKYLPNIFPNVAPGNFTYQESIQKWVFTTFYDFQWDLNYGNPTTLNSITREILFLINRGVDVIRIDAIRHIWKEIGTNCSNLPQVHTIIAILKKVINIMSPGVIFLGEAITSQQHVLEYFGTKQDGCELMYNVTFMSGLWNSLATKDVRYMYLCMQNSPNLPTGVGWLNYLRCHDDLDFILEDKETCSLGFDPFLHKQFLIDFYKGDFPNSFAKGEIYAYDDKTKNARISGTLASMSGLEKGIHEQDQQQINISCDRILLLYGLLFAYSGVPLIYSGDEIGALNDYSYKNNSDKIVDSRWLHRACFDWRKAKSRYNFTCPEGIIFQTLKKLIYIRKQEPIFHSRVKTVAIDLCNKSVFGCYKKNSGITLLVLANFTDSYQSIDMALLNVLGFSGTFTVLAQNKTLDITGGNLYFKPYEFFWLKQELT